MVHITANLVAEDGEAAVNCGESLRRSKIVAGSHKAPRDFRNPVYPVVGIIKSGTQRPYIDAQIIVRYSFVDTHVLHDVCTIQLGGTRK